MKNNEQYKKNIRKYKIKMRYSKAILS